MSCFSAVGRISAPLPSDPATCPAQCRRHLLPHHPTDTAGTRSLSCTVCATPTPTWTPHKSRDENTAGSPFDARKNTWLFHRRAATAEQELIQLGNEGEKWLSALTSSLATCPGTAALVGSHLSQNDSPHTAGSKYSSLHESERTSHSEIHIQMKYRKNSRIWKWH